MKIKKAFDLPKKYRAAVLKSAGVPLEIEIKDTKDLNKGEVWVQIKASPINPSDLAMLLGGYPHKKKYPFVPGLEASGIVVASGGGFMANYLLGKRVACSASDTGDGTWAEYMKVPSGNCIPLISSLSFEQGASSIVNPLTALALIERVKQSGSRSFINTAAASALGKMLNKISLKEGLTPINIVRRPEQVSELKNIGAQLVLDSSDPSFEDQLQELFDKHKTKIILDAISGSFAGRLLELAPQESILVLYAALSLSNLDLPPAPIIRFGKKVEGFHLAFWFSKQSKLKLIKTTRKAQKLIAEGSLASKVAVRFPLEDINTTAQDYYDHMTEGKHLLVFE